MMNVVKNFRNLTNKTTENIAAVYTLLILETEKNNAIIAFINNVDKKANYRNAILYALC